MGQTEESAKIAHLALETWAGLRLRPIEVIGETPKRYRVRLLEDTTLPSGRYRLAGEVVLVPKQAVRFEAR